MEPDALFALLRRLVEASERQAEAAERHTYLLAAILTAIDDGTAARIEGRASVAVRDAEDTRFNLGRLTDQAERLAAVDREDG